MAERGISVDHSPCIVGRPSCCRCWGKRFATTNAPSARAGAWMKPTPKSRLWKYLQDPADEVPEQYHRAGPSRDQAAYPLNARVQEFPVCTHPAQWHRGGSHDRRGADERQWRPAIFCRAVLFVDTISIPIHIRFCLTCHCYRDKAPPTRRIPGNASRRVRRRWSPAPAPCPRLRQDGGLAIPAAARDRTATCS
ncbi:hypothetical protein LMG29542_08468 [Paraburkholderia humisilvae]|uniref:Uncharacterized protein n=1 Tax=Paraburkholderia humisilvae TaxID=627669 RepID=A0A6J5FCU0_9BURK|nr:hypothetical protein LMG29542_08468 [Paraburkholderia humisilvae]